MDHVQIDSLWMDILLLIDATRPSPVLAHFRCAHWRNETLQDEYISIKGRLCDDATFESQLLDYEQTMWIGYDGFNWKLQLSVVILSRGTITRDVTLCVAGTTKGKECRAMYSVPFSSLCTAQYLFALFDVLVRGPPTLLLYFPTRLFCFVARSTGCFETNNKWADPLLGNT